MILSPRQDVIVSSIGWTDDACLWILRTADDHLITQRISDARYLSLHAGKDGYFAVQHHYQSARLCITAHAFTDPATILSRLVVEPSGWRFEADLTVWKHLPTVYVNRPRRLAGA